MAALLVTIPAHLVTEGDAILSRDGDPAFIVADWEIDFHNVITFWNSEGQFLMMHRLNTVTVQEDGTYTY